MESYVCAFRGRRDAYQVPLALAEGSILDQFITDAYASPWIKAAAHLTPAHIREKIRSRCEPGLPSDRVRCLWPITAWEHVRHTLGYSRALTYMRCDRHFSDAAARRAQKHRTHLLLYSPYAWEAFGTAYPHTPRRILFQYHPHADVEARILSADHLDHPTVGESFAGVALSAAPNELVRRERDCWQRAELVICASEFTRQSLAEAGCDLKKCCVVPYGIDEPDDTGLAPDPASFQAIYVGSGGQRKGLHHLLLAWRRASLPASSRLLLVCRVLDDGIRRMLADTPRVKLIRGAMAAELSHLYATSTLFVMPSLVEGFGQVYLEALAHGCPVLGTRNTCLPDLGGEANGVFMVSPSNVDELAARLTTLAKALPQDLTVREAARNCARRFTWSAFRAGLRKALET